MQKISLSLFLLILDLLYVATTYYKYLYDKVTYSCFKVCNVTLLEILPYYLITGNVLRHTCARFASMDWLFLCHACFVFSILVLKKRRNVDRRPRSDIDWWCC